MNKIFEWHSMSWLKKFNQKKKKRESLLTNLDKTSVVTLRQSAWGGTNVILESWPLTNLTDDHFVRHIHFAYFKQIDT